MKLPPQVGLNTFDHPYGRWRSRHNDACCVATRNGITPHGRSIQNHCGDCKKDVIISGGENVGSIEVENAVFSHPDVLEVAVIGVPDAKWGELVMALVVKKAESPLTEAELIAYVKTKLAGYKCPKKVEFRNALARTTTGKLQKFKLRAPYWEGFTRQVN